MSKLEKQLERICKIPTNYKWDELVSVLQKLGFEERQGSGSRVKFVHANTKEIITLHKPHPSSTLKKYAIRDVVKTLKEMGFV